jgi:hypothetical protein
LALRRQKASKACLSLDSNAQSRNSGPPNQRTCLT